MIYNVEIIKLNNDWVIVKIYVPLKRPYFIIRYLKNFVFILFLLDSVKQKKTLNRDIFSSTLFWYTKKFIGIKA